MALSRIGSSAELANVFARLSYTATTPRRPSAEKLHATTPKVYPEAPSIPLPSNVSEIFNIVTSRFTPERARDIAAPLFLYNNSTDKFTSASISFNHAKMHQLDSRVDSYDCFDTVSLNSAMQTNVPKPFCATGRSTYLNMPGGQWRRDGKYLAEIMTKSIFSVAQMQQSKKTGNHEMDSLSQHIIRSHSTASASRPEETRDVKKSSMQMSKKERLQLLIRDYGRTVIVFHIGISLISLGTFYALVSSGLDMTPVIKIFTPTATEADPNADLLVNTIMGEGSTFLIAYAIHKLFAPIRISLTLGATPIIVRYLRNKGILRPPKPTVKKSTLTPPPSR
ncbi:uncharacterized protein LOC131673524 [Phymastichus coffea]|uniref:uncharacterized protein LOC131673524 n=1 Tax=Phymastichus coffea TaxID=108790 RepID=UPI00273B5A6F|nr:uncharacterized protein LOC131673524 [Phymastichus coffea]